MAGGFHDFFIALVGEAFFIDVKNIFKYSPD